MSFKYVFFLVIIFFIERNSGGLNSTACTGQNEYLADYPPTCPNETCKESIMNPARCRLRPRLPVRPKPTCRCERGFFRNETGACVKFSECPAQDCPSGEHLSACPPQSCAGEYCPTSPTSPSSCPAPENCSDTTPKCTCNFNTRRSRPIGNCVNIRDCAPYDCPGEFEKYVACPPACPAQTCAAYLSNATCPRFRIGIVVECKPTCRCEDGYYRDSNNTCVPADECACDNDDNFDDS